MSHALENSHLIHLRGGADGDAFYAHYAGRAPGELGLAGRVAWRLEQEMLAAGWPVGEVVGSEAELLRNFGVARDTFREAVRILERRGASRMTRGRSGGLTVQRPDERQAAFTLAAYLGTIGCPAASAIRAAEAASAEPGLALLAPLYRSVATMLTGLAVEDDAECFSGSRDNPHVSAAGLSVRLMNDFAQVGAGVRMGSEWELGARYAASHRIMRQALRVLGDFDVLETRRGRRGGVFLRRPTPAGVVRQLFPYLSTHFRGADLLIQVWHLNRLHLRLAFERLDDAGPASRRRVIAALAERIAPLREPWRWVVVQEVVSDIARNPLVDTMIRCLLTHALRYRGGFDPIPPHALAPLLKDEREVLGALQDGDWSGTDAALFARQRRRADVIAEALAQHPSGPADG